MRRLYLLFLPLVLVIAGCATTSAPVKEGAPESEAAAPEVVEKKEPVKVVTTVFDVVKEVSFYADGVVDEVTLYTYNKEGDRLLKKELFDSDNVIQSSESFEYDSAGRLSVKRMFDKAGELTGYHKYGYDSNGNLVADEIYTSKDELQSKLEYEYKDGKRVKWNVYDGSGALLSITVYEYENGLNTKIKNLNPGGDLEGYFLKEYNKDGLLIKDTHYSMNDKILDSRTYEYSNGFLVMETVRRANGSVKRKIAYSNDKNGNPVEITYMDAGNNVSERVQKEYKSRDVITFETR